MFHDTPETIFYISTKKLLCFVNPYPVSKGALLRVIKYIFMQKLKKILPELTL